MVRRSAPVYLDYNAGAPLRPAAKDEMFEVLGDHGNASSVHADGRRARARIEAAREKVARLCSVKSRSVTFVSGGTEANMSALTPVWQDRGAPVYLEKLYRSAIEHPSVATGGRFSASSQEVLPVDEQGCVRVDALEDIVRDREPGLISVMAANNETGACQPLKEIGAIACRYGHFFHVDAVQAAGRVRIDPEAWKADILTLSAHKLGGPQGIGAVVVRSTSRLPSALMVGGGQENWRRGGTENVAAIAGFGVAADNALEETDKMHHVADLRERLEAGLKKVCAGTVIFGEGAPRLPNTTCFAVEGILAETALISFDLEHVSISSGSACSSGKVSVSHVLTAMGVPEALARCALRVSFGWNTNVAEIERFLEVWPKIVDRLNPEARSQAA